MKFSKNIQPQYPLMTNFQMTNKTSWVAFNMQYKIFDIGKFLCLNKIFLNINRTKEC